jgi:3-oxoacyl-[acyl-carrier-protein] synthase III
VLPVRIVSTGCCIPSIRVESSELDRRFGVEPGQVERLTGIRTRYYSNETETAPYLGAKAAAGALVRAGLALKDVDALVSVNATAPQLVPCAASLVLREMGELDAGIAAFDVNATCLSFLAGFDLMAQMIAAGRYRRVLLVASEASSPMLNPAELESASLIGDGAAAVVLERAPEGEASAVLGAQLETYPRGVEACELPGLGTTLHPKGRRKTSDDDSYFRMDGQGIFRLTYGLMPAFMEKFMRETGLTHDNIDLLIPHQASGPAVRIMLRRFVPPGTEGGRVFIYLEDYGNVGAASIPLGIHLALERGTLKRGQRVLLVGTGAGLQIGAASFIY